MPSKIYVLAFGRKIHGYEIAKIISNREKSPHPSNIYEWIKKMGEEYFDFSEFNIGRKKFIRAKCEPLVNELGFIKFEEDIMKIKDFLDSEFFRQFVNEANNRIDFNCNINAVENILGALGVIMIFVDKLQKYTGKWKKHFDSINEHEYIKGLEGTLKDIEKTDLMRYVPSPMYLSKDYVLSSRIVSTTLLDCNEKTITKIKDLLPDNLQIYKNILNGFLDINTYAIDKISPIKQGFHREKSIYQKR
jgi:hypothetical protein